MTTIRYTVCDSKKLSHLATLWPHNWQMSLVLVRPDWIPQSQLRLAAERKRNRKKNNNKLFSSLKDGGCISVTLYMLYYYVRNWNFSLSLSSFLLLLEKMAVAIAIKDAVFSCGLLPPFPNQQRTLNKLPAELQCWKFITKHRRSTQIGAKRAKTCVQGVHIPMSFYFCIHDHWWLGFLPTNGKLFGGGEKTICREIFLPHQMGHPA